MSFHITHIPISDQILENESKSLMHIIWYVLGVFNNISLFIVFPN